MRTTKTCPDCGEVLAIMSWVSGVVWECSSHGVRDWWFEPGAVREPPSLRPLEDPAPPAPATRKLDAPDPFSDTRGG